MSFSKANTFAGQPKNGWHKSILVEL